MPQGSAIFDFIAEIVLSYSDLLLHNKLKAAGIEDGYEILRYRDDYKVFCNDKRKLSEISYILQEILESFNLRMNVQKTKITKDIIKDSIKSDKIWYIENTPIFNRDGSDFDGIQKYLLYVLLFGRKFPNGGQLKVMLSDLDRRIIKKIEPTERMISLITETEKQIPDFIKQIEANSIEKKILSMMNDENNNEDKEQVETKDSSEEESFYKEILENIRAISAVAT